MANEDASVRGAAGPHRPVDEKNPLLEFAFAPTESTGCFELHVLVLELELRRRLEA